MKRFLGKVLIFIIIISILIGVIVAFDIFVVGSQYKYSYDASLLDKVERLKSINEPKIILVGNSNVSFGMDSEMLEEAFDMPVVNLGLHGSLGNAFHENIAKMNLNEGDIVIVCHSSFSDSDDIPDPELAWLTIDNHAEIAEIIREKDYPSMPIAYLAYVRKAILLWMTHTGNMIPEGCYSRTAFNKYGDVIYKPDDLQVDENYFSDPKEAVRIPQINETCTNRLNEFNEYVIGRGATLLVAGYPIAYGKYSSIEKSELMEFQNTLQSLLNCEVISNYTDYLFPYELFYNGILHLNKTGAEVRTQQLINDLRVWMAGRGEKEN